MAKIRHLRNAPITEAIVDFRVVLPSDFRPDQLRMARQRLAVNYPKADERKGMETLVKIAPGQPAGAQIRDLGFQGLWLKTEDEKAVAQFRIDGFTFNRLKPYTSWEQILPETLRLWDLYIELARPQGVTRVALRYINHMNLPRPGVDLDDYITTGPRLPTAGPEVLSSFMTRIVLKDPERQLMANVVQALEIGVETPAPSLLFDIDVYRTGDFDVHSPILQDILRELRAYKNEIFFGSLTERFVELFE